MEIGIGPKAILMLQDGSVFEGNSIGKIGTTTGEICFNTGMTGYQEIFTDPSYSGQIIVMTNDHIGNYGVHTDEVESDQIQINGLICKQFTYKYSRKQAAMSLNDYLVENNLIGICNVDTRQIVRHIRDKGAMNCIISSDILDPVELAARLKQVPSMEGLELASTVSTDEAYELGNPDAEFRIAVLDYGVKQNILRCLIERNCYLKVFPHSTGYDELKAWNPDGYMLSNGPGDPSVMHEETATVKRLLDEGETLFGICLGSQLLAQSVGMRTFKMHNGHRGLNHPVKNLINGRSEITSQNHGFAIDPSTVNEAIAEITHMNLNDNTVEGIRIKNKPAFAVQYHPEAAPGPHDSRYLFDQFIDLIRSRQHA